ncbi:hypothetical protein BaRGS_00031346, partial [Batillaria attramentaria]
LVAERKDDVQPSASVNEQQPPQKKPAQSVNLRQGKPNPKVLLIFSRNSHKRAWGRIHHHTEATNLASYFVSATGPTTSRRHQICPVARGWIDGQTISQWGAALHDPSVFYPGPVHGRGRDAQELICTILVTCLWPGYSLWESLKFGNKTLMALIH